MTEIANELGQRVVDVEFIEEDDQQCLRPRKRCRSLGEEPKELRTKRLAPVIEISLVPTPDLAETFACGGESETAGMAHRTNLQTKPPRSERSHDVRLLAGACAGWPKAVLALVDKEAA